MMATEVDPKSEANNTVLESPQQEQFFKMMSYLERGRMEEQRCALSPVKTVKNPPDGSGHEEPLDNKHLDNPRVSLPSSNYQEPRIMNHHGSAPQISVTESTPDTNRKLLSVPANQLQTESSEQEKFMNTISFGQRGRMDDQRCSLDPSRSAPCTPQHTKKTASDISSPDPDKFFNLLANSQGQRLDDQQVSLPSLPGIQKANTSSSAGGDSGYLCYMVSKVQGSRMEDQRCSLPLIQCPETQSSPEKDKRDSDPPRSASFSTKSDIEQPKSKDKAAQKQVLIQADQECLFTLMSNSQRGRMDEQRCSLNVSPASTPKHKPNQSSESAPNSEKFFQVLASSQSRRLDDQRVSLPSLPGIKNGSTSSTSTATEKDASYLCYMVSKVQGSRMDDQRCAAPQLSKNVSTPSAQRKDRPVSDASDKPTQRSSSRTDQHQEELSSTEQDRFLKMISHAQSGRMDEQRCVLPPSRSTPVTPTHNGSTLNNKSKGADANAFFNFISSSQARRLDDQRVALPTLPGISGRKESKGSGTNKKAPVPHITVAKSTPTTKKDCSRSTAQPQRACEESDFPKALPKSASFTPGTEYQRNLNSPGQMTLRVSMSFTPQQGQKVVEQPCAFPEVFLTLGAPGDNLVIPLSPVPGRPLSLNLNLVPKDDVKAKHCSSSCSSPRKSQSRPASPNPAAHPISPDEDCFSLIEKVHTAQLQKGAAQGQKLKGEQRKGKGGGKKDKKDGGRKQ